MVVSPSVSDVADTPEPRSTVFLGSGSTGDELLTRVKASFLHRDASFLDSTDTASGGLTVV